MRPLSFLGRAALSWVFVSSGIDVLRHPDKPAATAGWLFDVTRSAAPVPVPPDVHLVRANAAVQVVAATVLATGRGVRPAAVVLIGSLVPTTAGGHAFWRFADPVQRKAQRLQFSKNLGLLGGLLLAVDRPHDTSRTIGRFRKGALS